MSTPTDPRKNPYDPIAGESSRAFQAFAIYRDLGVGRSIDAVRERLGSASSRYLQKWSSDNNWVERGASYDSDREREKLAAKLESDKTAYLEKLAVYNQAHESIGNSGLEFVGNYMLIANSLLKPIADKLKATPPVKLTQQDIQQFQSLRRMRDVIAIADMSSQLLAEALHLRQLVAQLEGSDAD